VIDSGMCAGCGNCKKACPSKAIEGEKNRPPRIEPVKCTRCGICYNQCRRGAIHIFEDLLDDSLRRNSRS
jgi:heterodisulfide reductase subunit A-like polyferredoxin